MLAVLQGVCGSKEYQTTCLQECHSYLNSLYIWDFLSGSLNLRTLKESPAHSNQSVSPDHFCSSCPQEQAGSGGRGLWKDQAAFELVFLQLRGFVDILCLQSPAWYRVNRRSEKGFDGIFLFDQSKWKEAGHVQIISLKGLKIINLKGLPTYMILALHVSTCLCWPVSYNMDTEAFSIHLPFSIHQMARESVWGSLVLIFMVERIFSPVIIITVPVQHCNVIWFHSKVFWFPAQISFI